MKKFTKVLSLVLAMALLLCVPVGVSADEVDTATINPDALGSLTIFKFDYTNAKKDGVWDEDAFISTGMQESYVENALLNTNRKGDSDNSSTLGNGQTSNGYAVMSREDAKHLVDSYNQTLGVSKAQQAAMQAGSMFGFQVPAADPKNYDAEGKPQKIKNKERGNAR